MKYAVAMLAAVSLSLVTPVAHAEPPVSDSGHTHHVTTGNGDCVDISAVRFLGGDRGLHQGANSSGSERGPWHGSC